MNRNLFQLLLCCLGTALIASGCSQPLWNWGQTQNPAAVGAQTNPGSSPFGLNPAGDMSSAKNPLALARLSERRNQPEQAERLYLEVVKQTPNNPVPYHRLAVLYARRGRFKEADQYFARALTLNPDNAEVLGDAGYFYYLASRPQDAERCLRRALEIEPTNRTYCNNLALVIGEQGRRDECLALFRRSNAENHAYANLAFVLAQRGEYQQALGVYNRVLTVDPQMQVAAEAMIELSKYGPDKSPNRQFPGPGDGRTQLAANQNPNPGYPGAMARNGAPNGYPAQNAVPPNMAPNGVPYGYPAQNVAAAPANVAAARFPSGNYAPPQQQAGPVPSQFSRNAVAGPMAPNGAPYGYPAQQPDATASNVVATRFQSAGPAPAQQEPPAPAAPSVPVAQGPREASVAAQPPVSPHREPVYPNGPASPVVQTVAAPSSNATVARPQASVGAPARQDASETSRYSYNPPPAAVPQSTPVVYGQQDASAATQHRFGPLPDSILVLIVGLMLLGFGGVQMLQRKLQPQRQRS